MIALGTTVRATWNSNSASPGYDGSDRTFVGVLECEDDKVYIIRHALGHVLRLWKGLMTKPLEVEDDAPVSTGGRIHLGTVSGNEPSPEVVEHFRSGRQVSAHINLEEEPDA